MKSLSFLQDEPAFDLSADEIEYLSKLKVALQNVNRKLHHNITKIYPKHYLKKSHEAISPWLYKIPFWTKWFSLLTWLFGWMKIYIGN